MNENRRGAQARDGGGAVWLAEHHFSAQVDSAAISMDIRDDATMRRHDGAAVCRRT